MKTQRLMVNGHAIGSKPSYKYVIGKEVDGDGNFLYEFDVDYSKEDNGFIAQCTQFKGLSAFGDSAESAMFEAEIALKLFIESYKANPV